MISHKYKCIQVHIPKTAGVSIRSLFGKPTDKYMHIKPDNPIYQEYWNNYFRFVFVRNPWDRFLSGYQFSLEGRGNPKMYKYVTRFDDFNDFVKNANFDIVLKDGRFEPQVNWFYHTTGEMVLYNYVGQVESLEENLFDICRNIKMPFFGISKLNTTNHPDYREIYSRESKRIIAEMYKKDIERFNYEY